MNIIQSYLRTMSEYAKFTGRATRKEYWTFMLINTFIMVFLGLMIAPEITYLCGLIVFLPTLGVSVRRLHDSGKSGWFFLLNFLPLGNIVLIIFYLLPSEGSLNQYGSFEAS